jgi:Regulator of chromosome condensation (RCC1) repeat
VTWGLPSSVPILPPGVTYVDVAAGGSDAYFHTLARRSDGSLVAWGANYSGQCNVPALPPGLSYVEVAAGQDHSVARRSDGSVVSWGGCGNQCNAPQLPFGVTYVGVAAGYGQTLARCSDGSAIAWGANALGECNVPPTPPGMSYVQISAAPGQSAARLGPTSTYVTFALGCAGRQASARLVPLDTPRIGENLQVSVMGLPAGVAVMITGWSSGNSVLGPLPLPLAQFGMPGCVLSVSTDLATLVTGAGNIASLSVPIPNLRVLVGTTLHHQALIPDPAAANPARAVMSDAARFVIGA